jgi:GNAT superfamily N-acetyltransferase
MGESAALYKMRADSFEQSFKGWVSEDVLDVLMYGYSPSEFGRAVERGEIFVPDLAGPLAGLAWIEGANCKELAVAPARYGTGLARNLVIEVLRVLAKRSQDDIVIYAMPQTVNFFRRFGFRTVESVQAQHATGPIISFEMMQLSRKALAKLIG